MPVPMLPIVERDTTRIAELTTHLRRSAAASGHRNRARRPLEHGTVHGYIHHGCRCEECKTAIREYRQQARGRSVPNHLHGQLSTYQYFGCRCGVCKEAANEARAQYPKNRQDVNEVRACVGGDGMKRDMNGRPVKRNWTTRRKPASRTQERAEQRKTAGGAR